MNIVSTVIRAALLIGCIAAIPDWAILAAEHENAHEWEVRDFTPIPSQWTSGVPEELWERHIADWCCIRPNWIVGVLREGPALGSTVVPEMVARQRHVGAVAVNTVNGRTKWVTCDGIATAIDSVVPLGVDRVGIVTSETSGWGAINRCGLHEWNLRTDVVGPKREWSTLLHPVARVVDLDLVALDLTLTSNQASAALLLDVRHIPTGATVEIPTPFRDYISPTEMSALWEAGRETRWYAASDDEGSVVAFRGIRSGEWKYREPYAPESALTLFDPRAENGVRWQLSLDQIATSNGNNVVRIVPVRMPWAARDSLIVDWIESTDDGDDEVVHFAEIRLRDGTIHRQAEFENRSTYFQSTRWPGLSVNGQRIVFLDESNVIAPRLIHVFELGEKRSLDQIPNPSEGSSDLVTILPTNEAVIQGGLQVWAVGIGRANYGDVRTLCRLFVNDIGQ